MLKKTPLIVFCFFSVLFCVVFVNANDKENDKEIKIRKEKPSTEVTGRVGDFCVKDFCSFIVIGEDRNTAILIRVQNVSKAKQSLKNFLIKEMYKDVEKGKCPWEFPKTWEEKNTIIFKVENLVPVQDISEKEKCSKDCNYIKRQLDLMFELQKNSKDDSKKFQGFYAEWNYNPADIIIKKDSQESIK